MTMTRKQFESYDVVLDLRELPDGTRRVVMGDGKKFGTTYTIEKLPNSLWRLLVDDNDKTLVKEFKRIGDLYRHLINVYTKPAEYFKEQKSPYYQLPPEEIAKRRQIPHPPQIESGVTGLLEPNKTWSPSIADFDTRTMYPINHLMEEFDKLNKKPQFATGDVLDIQGTKLLVKSYNPISERYPVYPYVLGEFISATSYSAKLIDNQATKVYSLNTESEENENEHIN